MSFETFLHKTLTKNPFAVLAVDDDKNQSGQLETICRNQDN